MAYKLKHTGAQIDAGIDKANSALQSVPAEYITETELSAKGYATTTQLAGKQDTISDLATIRSGAALGATALQTETYKGTVTGVKVNGTTKNPSSGIVDIGTVITAHQDISGKADKSSLATVATSGSYNDLSNKPTIPSAVTETTVSGWGFTKNTGTYSKPSTGIPKTDLASAVQTSLGKADTALQSYTEQYKGTVTGVKINGSTKSPSSGVVDLGTVITSHQDISGKQDKLVSGTNIKTINGTSILGSGNIAANAYPVVSQGTSNTTATINPNTMYVWGTVTTLNITLGSAVSGVVNEYYFEFVSGTTATTLSLPTSVKWLDGQAPTIESGKIYQCSIINNIALIIGV